jgi:hypothetical protein
VASAVRVVSCAPCMRGILVGPRVNSETAQHDQKHLLPNNHVFCRHVFGLSNLYFAVDGGGIQGSRDPQDDFVGVELGVKVCFEVYRILDA